MLRRLLTLILGPTCSACGEHVRAERISLHWYIEHAGDLGMD